MPSVPQCCLTSTWRKSVRQQRADQLVARHRITRPRLVRRHRRANHRHLLTLYAIVDSAKWCRQELELFESSVLLLGKWVGGGRWVKSSFGARIDHGTKPRLRHRVPTWWKRWLFWLKLSLLGLWRDGQTCRRLRLWRIATGRKWKTEYVEELYGRQRQIMIVERRWGCLQSKRNGLPSVAFCPFRFLLSE